MRISGVFLSALGKFPAGKFPARKFPAGRFPAKNLPAKYVPVLYLRFNYTRSVLLSNTNKNDLARTADRTA